MPKTDKERRMAAGQVPVAGVDAIADAPAKPKPSTDKSRLGALRSKRRAEERAERKRA